MGLRYCQHGLMLDENCETCYCGRCYRDVNLEAAARSLHRARMDLIEARDVAGEMGDGVEMRTLEKMIRKIDRLQRRIPKRDGEEEYAKSTSSTDDDGGGGDRRRVGPGPEPR